MKTSHRVVSSLVTVASKIERLHVAILLVGTVHVLSRIFIRRQANRDVAQVAVVVALILSHLISSAPKGLRLLNRQPYATCDAVSYESKSFESRPIEPLQYRGGVWRAVDSGHVIRFRGINLPAKTPSSPSHLKYTSNSTEFYESKKTVSFVGRPFPIDTANEHFRRLSFYGYNMVRLSVTWEGVMHEGPGVIDREYIRYVQDLVDVAAKHGIYVIIDPHQDVWSRFTGGDGAPWWTLDAAGFNTRDAALHAAGCAVLHQHIGELPPMTWPTNYGRLATATMFTLFFAGDVYAPGINVPNTNVSVQAFLRQHYIEFMSVLAEALKDKINVLGFETMNEPSNGLVGLDDLRDLLMPAPYGSAVSGYDAMRLASGQALDIEYYSAPFVYDSMVKVNKERKSCWIDTDRDIWRNMGIYDVDDANGGQLLKPHHFRFEGDFVRRFMLPFFHEVQRAVAVHNDRFVVYAEPHIDVMDPRPMMSPDLDADRFGWAPHFYDAATLILKTYSRWFALDVDYKLPVVTPALIDTAFKRNIKQVRESGASGFGNSSLHVIIGETGIPFDMNDGHSFTTGDYSAPTMALDRTIRAIEANDLDYTLWNYVHDNTNADGDLWNGEDLSIWSEGRARGLDAAVRPYVFKLSSRSRVLSQGYDLKARQYKLAVLLERDGQSLSGDKDADCSRATLYIFVPSHCFTNPTFIATGTIQYVQKQQLAVWTTEGQCRSELLITNNEGGAGATPSEL